MAAEWQGRVHAVGDHCSAPVGEHESVDNAKSYLLMDTELPLLKK